MTAFDGGYGAGLGAIIGMGARGVNVVMFGLEFLGIGDWGGRPHPNPPPEGEGIICGGMGIIGGWLGLGLAGFGVGRGWLARGWGG